ncbi:hypothetical protein ZWY2020_037806 [Hordeum vulgare]|nr:hypothetical protein ZWY2020_037806 [Hordeum vulgare]
MSGCGVMEMKLLFLHNQLLTASIHPKPLLLLPAPTRFASPAPPQEQERRQGLLLSRPVNEQAMKKQLLTAEEAQGSIQSRVAAPADAHAVDWKGHNGRCCCLSLRYTCQRH